MGAKDLYAPAVFRATIRSARGHAKRLGRPIIVKWLAPGSPLSDPHWRSPRREVGYWQFGDSKDYFPGFFGELSHAVVHPDGSVEPGKMWDDALVKRPRRRTVRR